MNKFSFRWRENVLRHFNQKIYIAFDNITRDLYCLWNWNGRGASERNINFHVNNIFAALCEETRSGPLPRKMDYTLSCLINRRYSLIKYGFINLILLRVFPKWPSCGHDFVENRYARLIISRESKLRVFKIIKSTDLNRPKCLQKN